MSAFIFIIKTVRRLVLIAMISGTFQSLHAQAIADVAKSKQAPCISEGLAAWYRVPLHSLARRRAGPNEFTAAHNRLPIGTVVRVTRLSNGRNVIVRITDRGITHHLATIDLCKPAAERLGMVRVGISRVRLEIIPETLLASPAGNDSVGSH